MCSVILIIDLLSEMADVFDIDIGGEELQNEAQSDDEADQDSFQRWVWMRFMSSGIFATQTISFY